MATQKIKPTARRHSLEDLILKPESEAMIGLRRMASRMGNPMPLDELQELVDRELETTSLSEELIRMRHEDSTG